MRKNHIIVRKSILALLFLFSVCGIGITSIECQEKPNPTLIDEFDEMPCDRYRSRIDNLLEFLTDNPNFKAYIIIRGEKSQPQSSFGFKLLLQAYIDARPFDKSRIIFLREADGEDVRAQFWTSSVGMDHLNSITESWNFVLPESVKPFKVYNESQVSEVCPDVYNIEVYAKILLANPNARGHLVISEKSYKNFSRTKEKIISQLVEVYKISLNRIRTFYVKTKISDVEFWYVPNHSLHSYESSNGIIPELTSLEDYIK